MLSHKTQGLDLDILLNKFLHYTQSLPALATRFSWHAAGVYWPELLCLADDRWNAADKENERESWHLLTYDCCLCAHWLFALPSVSSLSLSASHWFTKHFRSFHRPHHNVLHCGFPLPAKHYNPTAWSNQKQHKRCTSAMHETINRTTKTIPVFVYFSLLFFTDSYSNPLKFKTVKWETNETGLSFRQEKWKQRKPRWLTPLFGKIFRKDSKTYFFIDIFFYNQPVLFVVVKELINVAVNRVISGWGWNRNTTVCDL